MRHPWYRITDAAVRRKRYNRPPLKFPLRGKRLKDVDILIKNCEENSKAIYDKMSIEFKNVVKHTIAEAPMTAEEAIMSIKEYARLDA